MKLLLSTARNDKSGGDAADSGKIHLQKVLTKRPDAVRESCWGGRERRRGTGRAARFQTSSRAPVLSLFANLMTDR